MNRNKRRIAHHAFYCAAGLALALPGASVAQTAGNQPAKPAWPDNGIAQRMLPGAYNMFVEQDEHGQWHAWVMNGDGEDAQALDFFSGKQMHVKAQVQDNGQQSRFFVDPAGGVHGPLDKGFDFTLPNPGGFRGGIWFGGSDFSLKGSNSRCIASFIGVQGGSDDEKIDHPTWTKIPIYHVDARANGCPSGYLKSSINTALDLDDGTFLVTMGCWIFRLRKSDLSPAGSAPGLRIVDKAELQAAINGAKGKNIQDVTDYLERSLNLSFDAANSCKSESGS